MRDSLRDEVMAFLESHGPRTRDEIASGVCARRADVGAVLAAGGFRPAQRPEGANPRAIYYEPSPQPSPPVRKRLGPKSRAQALLDVLEDGRRYKRDDIFRIAGRFFLTNNAMAELRAAGYDVRHEQDGELHIYWLAASPTEPEASTQDDPFLPSSAASGSVDEVEPPRLFGSELAA